MKASSDQQTKSQLSKKLDRHLSNPPQIAQRCPLDIHSSALWWTHLKGEGPDIQLIFWTDGQCFLSKPNTWRRPQTYYANACHSSSRCEAHWIHPGHCRLCRHIHKLLSRNSRTEICLVCNTGIHDISCILKSN